MAAFALRIASACCSNSVASARSDATVPPAPSGIASTAAASRSSAASSPRNAACACNGSDSADTAIAASGELWRYSYQSMPATAMSDTGSNIAVSVKKLD